MPRRATPGPPWTNSPFSRRWDGRTWRTIRPRECRWLSLPQRAGSSATRADDVARHVYEAMRPYASTVIVVRAPAAACMGPADHYLGLVAGVMGDLTLAEVHHEAALRLARRMGSPPFVTAAEVELGRTLHQRRREGDEERVALLLRNRRGVCARHGPAAAGAAGRGAGLDRRQRGAASSSGRMAVGSSSSS